MTTKNKTTKTTKAIDQPIIDWPSGLPFVSYVVADGAFLCVSCARNGSLASAQNDDPQWQIIGAQVNAYPTQCAHCDRIIPTFWSFASVVDAMESVSRFVVRVRE